MKGQSSECHYAPENTARKIHSCLWQFHLGSSSPAISSPLPLHLFLWYVFCVCLPIHHLPNDVELFGWKKQFISISLIAQITCTTHVYSIIKKERQEYIPVLISKDLQFEFVRLNFVEIYCVGGKKALGLIFFFALWNGTEVEISHFFFFAFFLCCNSFKLKADLLFSLN